MLLCLIHGKNWKEEAEMNLKEKEYIKIKYVRYFCLLVFILFLYGCGNAKSTSNEAIQTKSNKEIESELERQKIEQLERLTQGDISLSANELTDFASETKFIYDVSKEQLVYTLSIPQIPQSDDAYVYLFRKECFDKTTQLSGEPIASGLKGTTCEIIFPYVKEYLFENFVPALLIEEQYIPISNGIYLSNPEALAKNQDKYPETNSKKGLLLDPTMVGSDKLTDLGVKHAIYNIPLSIIISDNNQDKTKVISYTYKGKAYYFNKEAIEGYDGLFTFLNKEEMTCTAIILNDWNESHIELIHPDARNKESGAYYYMFNTMQKEGTQTIEAIASFLTERYSGEKHGLVHSWVIANEINQQKIWNYMDTDDVDYYAEEFEKAFRIFYQAAKSQYADSKVYFSIDHDWNNNENEHSKYFNGRDLVTAFNKAALKHGNYDWGIALHPYPNPIARVDYWKQQYDKSQDAEILSLMNLYTLIDFLKQDVYLNTENKVRNLTITELGFTSSTGEKLQAAAFAYCYHIVEANPYINAFIMNRQTDAPEELKQGLAFGIYKYNQKPKFIKEVFQYIDTDKSDKYTTFMLEIIGAETLNEALSWAE